MAAISSTVTSWVGPTLLFVFCAAYALVLAEEKLHLRKSKPVLVAAGLIWILVAIAYLEQGRGSEVAPEVRLILQEFAELFLFLLSAMSFVNAMAERNVFGALRGKIMRAQLSTRGIFWTTGLLAFVLSPIADNLTTGLVMGTVVISVLGENRKATAGALVNVVTAANAGGAFSPFGDITTLMIWQQGAVQFSQFFVLFVPSLVSWLIPAAIISIALKGPASKPHDGESRIRRGGLLISALFLCTIAGTVLIEHTLHLPPFLGMMLGLGLLNVYSYFLHRAEVKNFREETPDLNIWGSENGRQLNEQPFDIFKILEKTEWDTLLFFYGIMLCIGGIAAIGYLETLSRILYGGLGNTTANILIGALSAVIGNIPLTFAVLTMRPEMDTGQWLLITLTAGVGGALLSIGSAAGVALMGPSKGSYTFISHLKWAWAILLGFAGGVAAHLVLNRALFVS